MIKSIFQEYCYMISDMNASRSSCLCIGVYVLRSHYGRRSMISCSGQWLWSVTKFKNIRYIVNDKIAWMRHTASYTRGLSLDIKLYQRVCLIFKSCIFIFDDFIILSYVMVIIYLHIHRCLITQCLTLAENKMESVLFRSPSVIM